MVSIYIFTTVNFIIIIIIILLLYLKTPLSNMATLQGAQWRGKINGDY